jgi:hypothetical protein
VKTSYTRHAWSRVLERLSLGPAEVADLLDWSLAVDIGVEPGTNRVHRLFFSAPDGVCFVAVQDQKYGAVVTLLPVDFHEKIAWQVSLSAQETARGLAAPGQCPAPRIDAVPAVAPSAAASPRVFRVGAYVWTTTGLLRAVNLGSWPRQPYDDQVAKLLEDDAFFRVLDERLAAKGVEDQEVDTFFVRLGQDGPVARLSPNIRDGRHCQCLAIPVRSRRDACHLLS